MTVNIAREEAWNRNLKGMNGPTEREFGLLKKRIRKKVAE